MEAGELRDVLVDGHLALFDDLEFIDRHFLFVRDPKRVKESLREGFPGVEVERVLEEGGDGFHYRCGPRFGRSLGHQLTRCEDPCLGHSILEGLEGEQSLHPLHERTGVLRNTLEGVRDLGAFYVLDRVMRDGVGFVESAGDGVGAGVEGGGGSRTTSGGSGPSAGPEFLELFHHVHQLLRGCGHVPNFVEKGLVIVDRVIQELLERLVHVVARGGGPDSGGAARGWLRNFCIHRNAGDLLGIVVGGHRVFRRSRKGKRGELCR